MNRSEWHDSRTLPLFRACLIEIQVLILDLDFCILLNVRMFYRRVEFSNTCARFFIALTSSGALTQLEYVKIWIYDLKPTTISQVASLCYMVEVSHMERFVASGETHAFHSGIEFMVWNSAHTCPSKIILNYQIVTRTYAMYVRKCKDRSTEFFFCTIISTNHKTVCMQNAMLKIIDIVIFQISIAGRVLYFSQALTNESVYY